MTKKSVLKHLWNLFENAVKISDKLSILKLIEKTSDNLPTILWNANDLQNTTLCILMSSITLLPSEKQNFLSESIKG